MTARVEDVGFPLGSRRRANEVLRNDCLIVSTFMSMIRRSVETLSSDLRTAYFDQQAYIIQERSMASGTVVFISRNQGMIVVQHAQGFAVVELLGGEGEIERGDQLRGDWLALGGDTFLKAGESYDAYFQGCWGNAEAAVSMARRIGGG